jgi:hypothetical protein
MTPLAETYEARLPGDSVALREVTAIIKCYDASGSLGVKETAIATRPGRSFAEPSADLRSRSLRIPLLSGLGWKLTIYAGDAESSASRLLSGHEQSFADIA